MLYRKLGETGIKVSRLGFGAMRPPMTDGENIDSDLFIAVIHRAIDLGVNYIDTAHIYQDGASEQHVGRAVKGRRDQLVISTKVPCHSTARKWQEMWETSLKRLGTYVDILFFHTLRLKQTRSRSWSAIEKRAQRAIAKGDARILAFSCHDTPENVRTLLDTGLFKVVLLQYNLLNRAYEEVISYAHKQGIGTVLMGPCAGGMLAAGSGTLKRMSPVSFKNTPELAFRYVWSNRDVDCALSGMNTFEMVDQNVEIASIRRPLSAPDRRTLAKRAAECANKAETICTGCGYCMPCPVNVNIPMSFRALTMKKVWGLDRAGQKIYDFIGSEQDWRKSKKPTECIECGKCETKCPQNIPIRKQLKEVVRIFDRPKKR